jgi:hypothetical protein
MAARITVVPAATMRVDNEITGVEAPARDMFEMAQFIRVYKNVRVEHYLGSIAVPVSTDTATAVASKDDHAVSPDITVCVPISTYFHGGSFCHHTAFIVFHVPTSLAARTSTIVISDYCLVLDIHPPHAGIKEPDWVTLQSNVTL